MKFSCLFCVVLFLSLKYTSANESPLLAEILDNLKEISGRIRNLEEYSNKMSERLYNIEEWSKLIFGRVAGMDIFKACRTPQLLNADLVGTKEDGIYFNGSEIQVKCHFGYERIGNEYIQCLGRGNWSNTYCKFKDCGPPPTIEFGTYQGEIPTTLGSNVTVSCDDGYRLFGLDYVNCEEATRGWAGAQYCLPRVCFDVPNEYGENSSECFFKHSQAIPRGVKNYMSQQLVNNAHECIAYCTWEYPYKLTYITASPFNNGRGYCQCLTGKATDSDMEPSIGDTYYRENCKNC